MNTNDTMVDKFIPTDLKEILAKFACLQGPQQQAAVAAVRSGKVSEGLREWTAAVEKRLIEQRVGKLLESGERVVQLGKVRMWLSEVAQYSPTRSSRLSRQHTEVENIRKISTQIVN